MIARTSAGYCGFAMTMALLASGLTPPAQAGAVYGVKGTAQARARYDGGNGTVQTNRFGDATAESEMLWDPLSVRAGTTADARDGPLAAGALSSAAGYGGGLLAQVSSEFQGTSSDPLNRATGEAFAFATMIFKNSVSGSTGASGRLVITGQTPISMAGGPITGTAGYGLGMRLQAYAQGSTGCAIVACNSALQFGRSVGGGVSVTGDIPWRLEVDVKAGDQFNFTYSLNAHGSAGGGGSVGSIGEVAGSAFASMAATTNELAGDTSQGLGFDVMASPMTNATAGQGMRISLSPGLLLGDIGGLVQNADGSYGFAAPVPEVQSWAMLLAGLGLVGGMTRRGCRA
jgi:hypothetical protein